MVAFQKIKQLCQKPSLILGLILIVFFLKGILLSAVLPIFNGYDEARHYNTIQYLANPEKKDWPTSEKPGVFKGDLIQRFNYTEEIKKTSEKIHCVGGEFEKCSFFEDLVFIESFEGKNELEILNQKWKKYTDNNYTPNIAHSGKSLYHSLASNLEKHLSQKNILVRFYVFRIFSIFLGTALVLIFYLILKNTGFHPKHSLILTAIISFHPRFSFYYSYINYDVLLILSFALFFLAGVLALKNGPQKTNLILLILAVWLAVEIKGTGLILLAVSVPFLFFLFWKKIFSIKKNILFSLFSSFAAVFIIAVFYLKRYLPTFQSLDELLFSFGQFFLKNVDPGLIKLTYKTYWGTFLPNSWIAENFLYLIWTIEILSIAGLIFLFFSKRKINFLPEKKYIAFFIFMVVALQIGVRLADWAYFTRMGKLELQTPGRYFFPTLGLHLALIFVGLGAFLARFKKEKYFNITLSAGLVLMVFFFFSYLFNSLIPEFYF